MGFSAIAERKKLVFLLNCYAERRMAEQKRLAEEEERRRQREEAKKKRDILKKQRRLAEEREREWQLKEAKRRRQEEAEQKRRAEEEKRRRQRAEAAQKFGAGRRRTEGQGLEEAEPLQITFQEMEERSKREIQESPPATVESVPQKVYSPEELAREYRRLLSPGVILRHRRLGEGVLSRIENGYLYVRFHEEEKEKQFQYPQSVQNGYFTMIVPARTEQADSSKGGASYDRN